MCKIRYKVKGSKEGIVNSLRVPHDKQWPTCQLQNVVSGSGCEQGHRVDNDGAPGYPELATMTDPLLLY